MKELNKLWRVWQSGNIELCLLLIESQGLELTDTLIEFWDNYVPLESEYYFKKINIITNFNINITYNSKNDHYIVWSEVDSVYKLFYENDKSENTQKEAFEYFTEKLNKYINNE